MPADSEPPVSIGSISNVRVASGHWRLPALMQTFNPRSEGLDARTYTKRGSIDIWTGCNAHPRRQQLLERASTMQFDLDITNKISQSRTEAELSDALATAANTIGTPYFAAMVFFDASHGAAVRCIDAMPPGYWQKINEVDEGSVDPVMQHCRTSQTPIYWDRETYERAGCLDQWKVIHSAGLSHGVCMALHLAPGRHFLLSFDWPAAMADRLPDEAFRRRACLLLQACAVHAEPVTFVLWSDPDELPQSPVRGLTPRERIVLLLISRGHPDKAIARHLNISVPTVRKHMSTAVRKLNARNRVDAAFKALRLGLTRFSGGPSTT